MRFRAHINGISFTIVYWFQEYLKTMWSHSAEKGHHPSKYLNPMVHTSSSKECLVLSSSKDKTALSLVHQEGTKEDTQEETAQSSVVTGAAGNTPLQLSVAPGDGRRRTNRSSFFVTLAASNFKRRPTHHNKKIKYTCHVCIVHLYM